MISEIIAKTNGKDKVIDFRNGLSLANDEDYAMMHGVGGKDYSPNSVIKVTICDFTRGTGTSSVTVSANITPDVIQLLAEICKKNMGTPVVVGSNACSAPNPGNANELLVSIDKALEKARAVIRNNYRPEAPSATVPKSDIVEIGSLSLIHI